MCICALTNTNKNNCVSLLIIFMEYVWSEQMVMVICCPQLASTWIRSPFFCKAKLTYLVVICQVLT